MKNVKFFSAFGAKGGISEKGKSGNWINQQLTTDTIALPAANRFPCHSESGFAGRRIFSEKDPSPPFGGSG